MSCNHCLSAQDSHHNLFRFHRSRMSNLSDSSTAAPLARQTLLHTSFATPWIDNATATNISGEGLDELDMQSTMILYVCDNHSMDSCNTKLAWKYLVVILNFTAILVNTLHLMLLNKLTSVRGTSYLFILKLISIADIYSTLNILSFFCAFNKLFLGEHIYYAALLAAIKNHCGLVRFDTLAVASIERYLSICYPLHGSLCCDWLTRRNHLVQLIAISFWISSLLVSFFTKFLFSNELCMAPMHGPTNIGNTPSISMLVNTGYTSILSLIMLFSHIATLRQLKHIRGRGERIQGADDRLSTQAVYYILTINIMYYICLVPAVIIMILKPLGLAVDDLAWSIYTLYSCYGSANVVLYGWRNSSYRALARGLLMRNKTSPQMSQRNGRLTTSRPAANSTS